MRISTETCSNKIKTILIIAALVVAICLNPVTLAAYDDGYMSPEIQEMLRTENALMVSFNPAPGVFTEAETRQGIRWVAAGASLPRFEFPYTPVREGHTFDGWSHNGVRIDGDYIVVSDFMTLEAIWVAYGEASTYTPSTSPTPSPSPPPPGATATPAPTSTPSPTTPPTAGMPNPPNPTTNPIAISLMIFGAVAALGITAFSIINMTMRHTVAVGKYRRNAMRYKRESRLTSILGVGNKQDNKSIRHK
ncbi:MAG: hypothetical protein FWC92_01225 [Defluviitaleaceae bacterium]|nr:hypothetical protein [Defluviitaleaceae bacterium]